MTALVTPFASSAYTSRPRPRVAMWGSFMYAALALAAIAGAFLGGRWSSAASRYRPTHKQSWVLAVHLRFPDNATRASFLAAWAPLAAYVRRAEPRLLSYELSVSDTDPLHILVFERYVTKADYSVTHRASAAFFAFKNATNGMDVRIDGHSFIESNLGFV